jgi:S1-C subfamily serine protease
LAPSRSAALLVVLAAVSYAAAREPEPEPRAVSSLKDVESAVVQIVTIRTRMSGARTRHGSAFYFTPGGHLLTCAHVLARMPKEDAPRLVRGDGRELRFEVLRVDAQTDLALLLSEPGERFVALDRAPFPNVGERVLFAGASRGPEASEGPVSFRRCTVTAVGTRPGGGRRGSIVNIKVDQMADPGHSGGPLLTEGTLAGIGVIRANLESATGGASGARPQGSGLAVPLLYVKRLIFDVAGESF